MRNSECDYKVKVTTRSYVLERKGNFNVYITDGHDQGKCKFFSKVDRHRFLYSGIETIRVQ